MIYLIMGVMGSGKTTVGKMLADELGCIFREGDDYHSEVNVEKMREGIPLTDDDRKPWIFAVRSVIDMELAVKENAVLTCSALKEKYRKTLLSDRVDIKLIYLKGDMATIKKRIKNRKGSFASPKLLQSQFDDLEEPGATLVFDIKDKPAKIVKDIIKRIS